MFVGIDAVGAVRLLWLGALTVVCWRLVVSDLRHREFSSPDSIAINVVAMIGLVILRSASTGSVGRSVWAGVGAVVVALVLYQLEMVGGGDVKITFAPVALLTLFGAATWLVYLGVVIVASAIVLVSWLGASDSERRRGLPLGPVLVGGLPPAMFVGILVVL